MKPFTKILLLTIISTLTTVLHAGDSLSVRTIGVELAKDIAFESVKACRKQGFQVSAVVVDRNGIRNPR